MPIGQDLSTNPNPRVHLLNVTSRPARNPATCVLPKCILNMTDPGTRHSNVQAHTSYGITHGTAKQRHHHQGEQASNCASHLRDPAQCPTLGPQLPTTTRDKITRRQQPKRYRPTSIDQVQQPPKPTNVKGTYDQFPRAAHESFRASKTCQPRTRANYCTARIPTLPTHHTMRALHSHGWKSAQLWFWFGIYDGCDIIYDYYC
jgi:hypothetical protein